MQHKRLQLLCTKIVIDNSQTEGMDMLNRCDFSGLRSTQPFILNWWINRVPADSAGVRAGVAASVGWQVTL